MEMSYCMRRAALSDGDGFMGLSRDVHTWTHTLSYTNTHTHTHTHTHNHTHMFMHAVSVFIAYLFTHIHTLSLSLSLSLSNTHLFQEAESFLPSLTKDSRWQINYPLTGAEPIMSALTAGRRAGKCEMLLLRLAFFTRMETKAETGAVSMLHGGEGRWWGSSSSWAIDHSPATI